MCFENDNGDSEIWTCRTLWTWSCGIITASRCCINTRRLILLEKISLVCAGVRRTRTFWQWHMACTISSHSLPGKMVMLAFGISKQVFSVASLRPVNDENLMNFQNPINPERFYKYAIPVTCLAFSKENPQLLAVGLYDGSVEVIDITVDGSLTKVAISQRQTSPPTEPVWQVDWTRSNSKLFEYAQLLWHFFLFS